MFHKFINNRIASLIYGLLPSLFLMSLRGSSLAIKFVLMMLMGRYLGLADIGVYGLLVGITLIYSQMAGWGFGFNLSRHMVTTKNEERQELLARQWGVFLYTYLLTILIFVIIAASPLYEIDAVRTVTSFVCLIIILSEHASQELGRLLISTKQAIKGNILLFIRTAGWAVPIVVAFFYTTAVRNIEVIFLAWALGGAISVILGVWWSRVYVVNWRNFVKDAIHVPFSWLKVHISASMMVYLAFSISVVMSYLNRFTTGALLSLDETGLYTLYWSIINAICVLATTGFIQTSYPIMIEHHKDKAVYHKKTLLLYKQTIIFALISGSIIAAAAPLLFPLMHKPEAVQQLPVFYIMLVGGIIKLISTVTFYSLYARHDDKALMTGMLITFVFSLPLSFLCILFLGFSGAAVSDCLYGLILFIVLAKVYSRKMGLGFSDFINAGEKSR